MLSGFAGAAGVLRAARRGRAPGAVLCVLTLVLIPWPGRAAAAPPANSACPWMNPHQSADVRARELLAAMTPEQKMRWLDEQAANNPAQTTFGGVTYPPQVPCTPLIAYADGPWEVTGVTGITTGFPVPIAETATWDTQLSWRKGQAMGEEAFAEDRNGLLAPGINLARTSFGGRNAEFMGEDPLLAGTMAAQDILGIQKGNPAEPVEAVLKHWVANDQELDRQLSSSNVDDRTLHELDGLAFEVAITRSNPAGVMCSYNQINGIYACENPNTLTKYLKDELGYQGFVVSDFGAVRSTAPSLTAGLDQELNRPVFYSPTNLEAALSAGTITEAQIDAAAFRVAHAAIAEGLFDHPMPAAPAANASTRTHLALARTIAEDGTVLLKNSGTLPLTSKHQTIAVVGPTASATATNGVSAATVCTSSGEPSRACSNNPGFVAPLDAITTRAQQNGDSVTFDDGSDLASAAAAARSADVAVVFGYYTEGEGADRPNINLDNGGDALISSVAAANPNTVVVLETGSAVLMPWLGQVKSVLEAVYPGVQQGPSLAALLFGDVDPSGHLPVTFPQSTSDLPTAGSPAQYPGVFADGSTVRAPGDRTSIRQVDYTEGLNLGHRWYDSHGIQPLFPFGYGLSYTTFSVDQLRATAACRWDLDGLRVRFRVKNTGNRDGAQVEQVYLTLPASSGEPPKRLVGWSRVTLAPRQSRDVEVDIDSGSPDHPLSIWDAASQRWVTPHGTFVVSLGSSVDNIDAAAPIAVRGSDSRHQRR
jgi:beta-glucosidase